MKLKSADIVKAFIPLTTKYIADRWAPEDLPNITKAANNPKLWKRWEKCKVEKYMSDLGDARQYYRDITDYLTHGSEYLDILDPTQITDDCIYREFFERKSRKGKFYRGWFSFTGLR